MKLTKNRNITNVILLDHYKDAKRSTKNTHNWSRRIMCIWVKVFKNGPGKICDRQPLKNLK